MNSSLFTNKEQVMSRERWEIILQSKQSFLQDTDHDLIELPQLDHDILESWIRSRKMHVDPYNPHVPKPLTTMEYSNILAEYRPLIDTTRPLLNILKDMIPSDYFLEIIDQKGVSLLQEGELILPPIAAQGRIFNENTMGTNAHTLSMQLKRPVQLFGPEHYCVALENIIASAVPIMNESEEAIASLVLTQPMVSEPWEYHFANQLSHTMSLLISIAAAVETQIKLNNCNDKLKYLSDCYFVTNNTLEATLTSIDEAIIILDRTGQIIQINPEAARILKLKAEDVGKTNIEEFLNSNSRLLNAASKGEFLTIEETISVGNDEQSYCIKVRSVLSQNNQESVLSVLRLSPVEKSNCQSNSRSGATTSFHFHDIIGESQTIKQTIETGKRFANTPENILLIGESGTGKELFAQAIHNQHRPNGPFMAVNCAAMPRNLIESELFGYEGGSFTGAERSGRPGKIELAHGGTLFLDEIGDMPVELQAVLLRVLEDKQVTRIGSRRSKKVDFRVVAATNKDLYQMVKEKLFREDLYFRLSVLPITLPPLRTRGNDTEILCKYFIDNYCHKLGWKVPRLSPEALKLITEYNWPGNVRQLQNAINYALNTTQSEVIGTNNLPSYIILDSSPVNLGGISNEGGKMEDMLSIKKLEKAAIDLALLQSQNSIPRAAGLLGMSKATLYRKLKEFSNEQV